MGSFILTKDYWQQYTMNVKHCHLSSTGGHSRVHDTSEGFETISIPFSATKDLRKFSEEHSIEKDIVIRTAWILVLWRFTDLEEVCFGVYDRRHGDIVSGLCRISINPEDTVAALLARAQDDATQSSHYHVNLLPEMVSTAGNSNLKEVCNSAIVRIHEKSQNTTLEPIGYDIVICIVDSAALLIQYQSSKILSDLALRLAQTFGKALSSIICAEMRSPLWDLDMLSDSQEKQIAEWNTTSIKKVQRLVHEMVEKQVTKSPHNEAVCSWDGSFTYYELSRLSSRLALHLKTLGIERGQFVVLCLTKSKWVVVANLAVLKAGGACASVDPLYPQARLDHIISETRAKVILTQAECAQRFQGGAPHLIILGSSLFPSLPEDTTTNGYTDIAVRPTDAAFVVFTSGSTGHPKGIVQEHMAYCTSIVECAPVFASRPNRRHLQYAAHTFDNSISDIFVTLTYGGCVCVPSESDRLDPVSLASAMETMRVNQAELTPTVARMLRPGDVPTLDTLALTGEPATTETIRSWTEERGQDEHQERSGKRTWADFQLLNVYGPAETTILATVEYGLQPDTHPLHVGFAVGGRCWITDPHNPHQLAPLGAVGELVLEGPFLARGYLNDEIRTREVFIENPKWRSSNKHSTDPTSKSICPQNGTQPRRLYRTRDLARYDLDGSICLVGRNDTHVKLRGQRIELAGVERQICANSDVRHGAVLLPDTGLCRQSLVAVLSFHSLPYSSALSQSGAITIASAEHSETTVRKLKCLKEYLFTVLPTYMIPTVWIVIESFPTQSSGKLDRNLLKSWLHDLKELQLEKARKLVYGDRGVLTDQEHPLTEHQKLILRICSHTLNIPVETISLDDGFLKLGGDSISAISFRARCRSEGKFLIAIEDVLRGNSLRELARSGKPIEHGSLNMGASEVTDTLFDLSPIQNFFFAWNPEGDHEYTQSLLLRLRAFVPHESLESALETLTRRQLMLRAQFHKVSPRGPWKQLIQSYRPHLYHLSICYDTSVQELRNIMASPWSTLNIQTGPVFSAHVCEMANNQGQVLFLVAHHLIMDLVSWRTLLEDLENILENAGAVSLDASSLPPDFQSKLPKKFPGSMRSQSDGKNGGPSALNRHEPEAPLSFQTWTKMQTNYLNHNKPATSPACLPLVRTDRDYWGISDISNLFGDAESIRYSLSEDTTRALLGDCNVSMRTEPIDIFLGVFLHSFHDVFPDRLTPTFFNESHGRECFDESLELSTVGWFTTMFPVSLQINWISPVDTIRHVKDIRLSFPDRGWSWFSSRFLNSADGIEMEVIFNYFGLFQQIERKDAIMTPMNLNGTQPTEEGGVQMPRPSLFEVALSVEHGSLQINTTFNHKMSKKDRIRDWIRSTEALFLEVAHRLVNIEPLITLSDLPLLQTTMEGFDMLRNVKLPALDISLNNVEDAYMCSPMQQGLLISSLQHPQYYRIRLPFEMTSSESCSLEPDRLQAAWQQLVDRHTILRTLTVEDACGDGLFRQIVLRSIVANVKIIRRPNPEMAREAIHSHPPFQHSKNEVPHELLICSSASTGRLHCLLSIHHVITDGISLSLLMGHLSMAYSHKLLDNNSTPYHALISYLQSRPEGPMLDYWKRYLGNFKPCYIPISMSGTHNEPVLVEREVPLGEMGDLKSFCKSLSVTSTTLLHTAWLLVLQCYTGLDTPSFGYISSGRDIPFSGIQNIIGPCVNMLVRRQAIREEQEVSALLREVQRNTFESMNNQTCSLANIQQVLGLSGQQLFNTAMSQERLVDTTLAEAKGPLIELGSIHDPTEFALAVHVYELKDSLSVVLRYWKPVMADEQVRDIAHTFAKTLSSIVANPQQKVQDLERCSSHDIDRITEWNRTSFPLIDACIHHLIHDRAELQPQSEAICSWDGRMTYAEMDHAANRFASYIRQVAPHTRPDSFIPLFFSKSLWQPVAMLATMKTGAAFVTLDPTHPKDRLKSIVSILAARTILCSAQHLEMCLELAELVIVVDADRLKSLSACDYTSDFNVSPSNAAYAIFTSGSTGTPKGIVVEHKAYASNIGVQARQLHIKNTVRALQFASYVFDAFLMESITILALGGCVCIPSEDERLNDIEGSMRRMGVTWAQLTPSFAKLLDPSEIPALEVLVCGGEALSASVLHTWAQAVHLCNSYGPSECSVSSVINTCVTEATIPTNIGRGSGALTWIVDAVNHNNLLPIGSVGELLLEGPILARGYVNEKLKTDAAFINNPKWTEFKSNTRPLKQRRFFKTGDLCRYTSTGDVIYVGRKDTQIKVHGQRVEIDEIEHHLTMAPHVKHAVVTYPKTGFLRKKIVATLSLSDLPKPRLPVSGALEDIRETPRILQAEQEADRVRDYLSDKIPDYMAPKAIIVVEDVPLSIAGKLDRRQVESALTGITNENHPRAMSSYQESEALTKTLAPTSTPIEKHLQSSWSHVLNIPLDRIGKESSFLRLGGDSITALQLISKCRREGLRVSVQDTLRTKTLAELAQKASAINDPQISVYVQKEESDSDFQLSPIQELYFQFAPRGENQTTQSFFLRAKRYLDTESVSKAIAKLVSMHAMLRARFVLVDGVQWRQFIPTERGCESVNLACHYVSSLKEAKVLAEQSRRTLNIKSGPVYAINLFNIGGTQFLYLTAHHLVVDLVSWRIILQDLHELLQDNLYSPTPSTSYKIWCQEQAAYAARKLPPEVAFPSPLRPRALTEDFWAMSGRPNRPQDIIKKHFDMSSRETGLLLGRCNEVFGTKPLEIFHGCIIHSFHSIFGREPIVFQEGHGRESFDEKIDLSRTVGWFTSLYPVAVSLEGTPGLFYWIRNSKDCCRSIPGNGWPYFASRFLNPDGKRSFEDLMPEILVNYQGRFQQLERVDAVFEQLSTSDLIDSDDDLEARRLSLVDIEITVHNQCLQFAFSYNKYMKYQDRLEQWIHQCQNSLSEVTVLYNRWTPQHTLSDFPLFKGDYRTLDRLLQTVNSDIVGNLIIGNLYLCSPMQHELLKSQSKGRGHYQAMWLWEVTLTDPEKSISLDPLRLQKAWSDVVRRHECLRATVVSDEKQPNTWYQVVLETPIVHVSIETEPTAMARMTELQTQPPVDYHALTTLHRLQISKASADKLICRLEISHAISDGIAMEVLLSDWIQAYSGKLTDSLPKISEYRDYLRYLFTNPRLEAQMYWKDYLRGIHPCIIPVSPCLCPSGQSFHHTSVDIHLSSSHDMATFCETHEVTQASFVRTIWALVLHRYAHSSAPCFGYTVYGRDIPLENSFSIAGPLFNFLVYRASIDPLQSLLQLLHATQQDYVASLPCQVYSFPEAQATCQIPEIEGNRPFNTLVNYRRAVAPSEKQEEYATIKFNEIKCRDPMDYAIVLDVTQMGRKISMQLNYALGELDTSEVEEMARMVEALVTAFFKSPDMSVGRTLEIL